MNTVEKNADKENKYFTIEEMSDIERKIPMFPKYDVDINHPNNRFVNSMNDIHHDTIIGRLNDFSDEQLNFLNKFINLFEGDTKYYILNRLIYIFKTDLISRNADDLGESNTTVKSIRKKIKILNGTFYILKHIKNSSLMFDYFLHAELPTLDSFKNSPHLLFKMLLNKKLLLWNAGLYTAHKTDDEKYNKIKDEFFPQLKGNQR